MLPLFSAEGRAALQAALQGTTVLLGFDFDGTLAPIVARPDMARVAPALARRMARLAQRWPVAVLTGREVADVVPRLGFHPQYLVGNHGAESGSSGLPRPHVDTRALNRLRRLLAQHAASLAAAGVEVEDKHLSLALHYRRAPDTAAALRCIDSALGLLDPALRRFGGKCVVNLVAARAPDKADALRMLVRQCGASTAAYTGDDVNDEPVFEQAPAEWLTVLVGTDSAPTSKARFQIASQEAVADLVDAMLALA
jgi:trehalose 6-phosphate phosphatase